MAKYCVNKKSQPNGDYEVHNEDAGRSCLPDKENRFALGEHATCEEAMLVAKVFYATADGCAHCAPTCHTS